MKLTDKEAIELLKKGANLTAPHRKQYHQRLFAMFYVDDTENDPSSWELGLCDCKILPEEEHCDCKEHAVLSIEDLESDEWIEDE